MSIYDVAVIEKEIERIAEQNQGEIPEEKLRDLVEAQTKSLESIEKLCRYIRHLEMFEETCKNEERRIKELREKSVKRLESVKKYLTPFVKGKGKFDSGTFRLSIRKSEQIILPEDFTNPKYCDMVVIYKPDKKKIKDDLKKGEIIPGAELKEIDNLQIK